MSCFSIYSKSFSLLIAFAGLLAAGCGNRAGDKLVGTWEMQISGFADFVPGKPENKPPDDEPSIEDNTNSIVDGVGGGDLSFGGMTLVFGSDGSLKTITRFSEAQSEKDWSWTLISWDNRSASAVIRCQMPDEAIETAIQFIDDNTIELVPPNINVLQTRLRFVRK